MIARRYLLALVLSSLALNGSSGADLPSPASHSTLIGQLAPDLQADFSLNQKAVKISELRGKVVLLDFWAVWCGPCVATLPHLRDWHSEFKDKGLEVVGATTYYGTFNFDKYSGRVYQQAGRLSSEQEQGMLKDFAEYHRLQYRLMMLDYNAITKAFEDYRVRGIPQIVLIDRKGTVRMVRVGMGEASDVSQMIRELLAEKAQ